MRTEPIRDIETPTTHPIAHPTSSTNKDIDNSAAEIISLAGLETVISGIAKSTKLKSGVEGSVEGDIKEGKHTNPIIGGNNIERGRVEGGRVAPKGVSWNTSLSYDELDFSGGHTNHTTHSNIDNTENSENNNANTGSSNSRNNKNKMHYLDDLSTSNIDNYLEYEYGNDNDNYNKKDIIHHSQQDIKKKKKKMKKIVKNEEVDIDISHSTVLGGQSHQNVYGNVQANLQANVHAQAYPLYTMGLQVGNHCMI